MNQSDVQLHKTYQVKVANNLVPVTITGEHEDGGWIGVSTRTGKPIHIKNAERLRRCLDENEESVPNSQSSPAETPSSVKAKSLMEAAVQILSEGSNDAMRCQDIVDRAIRRGLWQPKEGKTPANSLYASILREIQKKGDQSRFVKVERGKFQIATAD